MGMMQKASRKLYDDDDGWLWLNVKDGDVDNDYDEWRSQGKPSEARVKEKAMWSWWW